MENNQLKQIKIQCLSELRAYLPTVRDLLCSIDERLWQYVTERTDGIGICIASDGEYIEDCLANVYELLGIRKSLRLLNTYRFNTKRARQWLLAQEGVWRCENGIWQHVQGGLAFDTPRGAKHVRLMPFQAWTTCMAMGFETDVCMDRKHDGSELLPSEYVGEDGMVWDKRRLCNEIHFFITRKAGKTEYGVSLDFSEMAVMGDMNAQVTIVGNSKDSAVGIAYAKAKQYAYHVDPSSTNKLGGRLLKVGASSMGFIAGCKRTASLAAFAAGGKPKDGWNSEWVHADEHGQAAYVNDHSDMENTVQVFVGSGGVRRERMLLHTTTAGLVTEGPYKDLLSKVQLMLTEEMAIPLGRAWKTTEDKWFAFLCQLDPWNFDGTLDSLNHKHLWKRVNPALGITVQPTWYSERLHEAATKNEDVRKEVLTKDFNIWQSERVTRWIQADEIRPLQLPMRIEDCRAADGWIVFAGLDFTNIGDDLQAQTYLAVRSNPQTGRREFFADLDAWVSQDTVEHSPIRNLLNHYESLGYLHIMPGNVISPNLPLDRCVSLRSEHQVNIIGWGYDAARAKDPINLIKDYLVTLGISPANLGNLIMPVSQKFFTTTGLIDELTYMVRCEEPLIHFSQSPLWPWEFQNCMIIESSDGMENKKVVKSAQENKVDNVQALLNALYVFDSLNSKQVR